MNNKMIKMTLFIPLAFLFWATGCGVNNPAPAPTAVPSKTSTIILPTAVPPTYTPLPTQTEAPPTLTPIPSPPKNVNAFVSADTLNLRNGPGRVFDPINQAVKGDLLALIGKATGNNDWVLVKKTDGVTGWAAVTYLALQGSIQDVTPLNIDFAISIHGKTINSDNSPVDKIDVAIYQGKNPNPPRTDVYSDNNGEFVAYLPKTINGDWFIEVVGYDCTSSIAKNGCSLSGHFEPRTQTIDFSNPTTPIVFKYIP